MKNQCLMTLVQSNFFIAAPKLPPSVAAFFAHYFLKIEAVPPKHSKRGKYLRY